ncbi:MAG: endo-1,4-beta-xylanase, partial [Planctomycetes bacterium]|nr:endo-1,4-beta-xylanase [Planctomycetota bacterium]
LFGANVFKWGRLPSQTMEQAYRKRFAELLNYATLAFYWPMYEPQRGRPAHEYTAQVARWCARNGIATKGHPLAWNMGDPPWLPDDLEAIRRLQMARIEDCVGHFAGLIDRWDVVNEATHFDRPDFVNRRSPKLSAMWKKVGRIEFARQCFAHARKANPKAVLLINDYRTDEAYAKVISGLVDDGGRRLYDVIGIQSHMHGGVWSNRKIWDVCQRFARFGVPLHFTETTIVSGKRPAGGGPWLTTPAGEAFQAREVVRFYTMLFSHPAVEAITWWNLSDYRAWQGAPAGLLRKDMSPKPAYEALRKLIKGEWWTKTSLRTDERGEAAFRGFLGDYRVTASLPGGGSVSGRFVLAAGRKNRWVVKLPQRPRRRGRP